MPPSTDDQTAANKELATQIAQLLPTDPRCNDWGARVQTCCGRVWALALKAEDVIWQQVRHEFNQLLAQPEAFALARLVIPELRSARDPDIAELPPPIAEILAATAPLRARYQKYQPYSTTVHDPVFEEQKRILLEAELYRSSVYLGYDGHLSNEDKTGLRNWIASKPDCLWMHDNVFTPDDEKLIRDWIASKPQQASRD